MKDNKYDQSFRRAELGVKKENEKDNFSYEDKIEREKVEEDKRMEEHFTREPDNFGGSPSWI